MNKVKITLSALLILTQFSLIAQTLKKVETYYDPYTRTKIHEAYTTLSTAPYLKQGVYKEWDQYGNLKGEVNFANGKVNGSFKVYFDVGLASVMGKELLGKVYTITNYSNDILNGVDQMFDYKYGKQQLIHQKTWVNGKQTKEETWQEDGKPIKSISINGPGLEYYPDGKKQREYAMKNEEFEGKFTSWFSNGQIEISTSYVNGLESGKHVEYFESGKPQLETTYVKGKISGLMMLYFEDGKTRKAIKYDPLTFNLIEEKEYARNGQLKFERILISGLQYKSVTYDSITTNKILEQEELNDTKSSAPIKDGKSTKYFSDGKVLAEAVFSKDKLNGMYKEFDEDGAVVMSGEYQNGYTTGEWLFHYDENFENRVARKKNAHYYRVINQSGNGPWKTVDYYISGVKQFEGFLIQQSPDAISGKAKFYHENGNLSKEIEFNSEGMPIGIEKVYDLDGRLEKESKVVGLEYDPKTEWIEYYPSGKIKAKGRTNTYGKTGTWEYYDESGKMTTQNH